MQTSSKARWPRVPDAGGRVALVCGSGPLRGEEDVVRAEGWVRALGWEPVRGAHVLAQAGYLAGRDDERLRDVQWALDDDAIDVVWFVRGGYGMTRLLPSVSLDTFTRRPKAIIGFSDVTALHCAIAARMDVVSFHAHTARAEMPAMSMASLQAALSQRGDPCGTWASAEPVRSGRARGVLRGGNLALLASLCGTPYAMDGRGAIIVLEDVSEAAYRVDRLLRQLEQAGSLAGCAGLAIGQFSSVPADENADAMTIHDLVRELSQRLGVPCLANLPIGHIVDQWCLPLGAEAVLDVASRSLEVIMPTASVA